MGFDTIHETVIRDIVDTIKDGIDVTRDMASASKGAGYARSLTQATKGLVMEFPVLVSKANHIESAGIVAKAYEAKFVTLLHMAFVASNITNSKEGLEYIKNFHTNLDSGKISVDKFIDVMDSFVESSNTITADSYAKYKAVTEDMKNLCYGFGEDINETSLMSYKVMNNYGRLKVVKEADFNDKDKDIKIKYQDQFDLLTKAERDMYEKMTNARTPGDMQKYSELYKGIVKQLNDLQQKTRDKLLYDPDEIDNKKSQAQIDRWDKQNNLDIAKNARDAQKHQMDMISQSQNIITNYIVPSDLKKANELAPTMMVVNFVYQENEKSEPIFKQMIVGVKAKLYEVEPMDVINKIITKHVDSNILLKLVQVNTRQISFVKDFLFAVDSAKLDALSRSKRGSTNKLFKVLERRAIGGRISSTLKMKDYCKAITSLVISQEEAEELLKNNIDVNNPKVIRNIMEQLNLISFAIIDESSESVKFIFDTGDDVYETIPLSKLEKEQKDGMSKKVINLMAKMNR